MSLSMYAASVPAFNRILTNLDAILAKAEAWATERKIDPNALLQSRLTPDMFTFTRQVQIATDMIKGTCGRLAGAELPRFEDKESSFAELRERVQKTKDFLATLQPAQFEGADARQITLKVGPPDNQRTLEFVGADYLVNWGYPNVYFHYTTAYALLRHNGLAIGKTDFLG
jgi:uncharacterized protein